MDFVQGAPRPFRTAPPQIPAEDVEFEIAEDDEEGLAGLAEAFSGGDTAEARQEARKAIRQLRLKPKRK